MLGMVKSLILDFQEGKVKTGVPRRLNDTPVEGKASVFVGVRRSGKSTLLMQRIRHLFEEGTPRENIVFLNFFDDRLHPLRRGGSMSSTMPITASIPGRRGSKGSTQGCCQGKSPPRFGVGLSPGKFSPFLSGSTWTFAESAPNSK